MPSLLNVTQNPDPPNETADIARRFKLMRQSIVRRKQAAPILCCSRSNREIQCRLRRKTVVPITGSNDYLRMRTGARNNFVDFKTVALAKAGAQYAVTLVAL